MKLEFRSPSFSHELGAWQPGEGAAQGSHSGDGVIQVGVSLISGLHLVCQHLGFLIFVYLFSGYLVE